MKKSFLRQILNVEYAASAVFVMVLVYLMIFVSGLLPEADETSFLNPIFDRIDFLNIDDVSLDAIFAMKPAGFPDARIVIVNVGEVSPTPDGKIAAAIEKAEQYGAKAIGVDVIFDALHFERFGDDRAWEKRALVDVLSHSDHVVLVNGFDTETLEPAFAIDKDVFAADPHFGYASMEKDDDGVVRRFWPYRSIEDERWLAFPIAVLHLYNPEFVQPLLRLPEVPQIIYYSATHNQFQGQTLPIDDVISHPEALAPLYQKLFSDAIVLIGFVNEGGLWYPGDTHKTPMGKKITVEQRDGSSRMGMEGPDMSGLLIHANVINMLLHQEFIQPVPAWVDWLLVFLLSYISIAAYRVLRTKPTSRIGIGALITAMLALESLVVFFLPILAFFNLDVKISYHLMATSVLLFIPANAAINKLRVVYTHWMLKRLYKREHYPPYAILADVYQDDESFPLYVRVVYAALYQLQYTYAVALCNKAGSEAQEKKIVQIPGLEEWVSALPPVDTIVASETNRDISHAHFYRYLAGMKDLFLRDSFLEDFFFQTEFSHYNPHHYHEQWEVVVPHVRRMYRTDLREYSKWVVRYASHRSPQIDGDKSAGTIEAKLGVQSGEAANPGVLVYHTQDSGSAIPASPYIIYTECKLHKKKELFVFAACIPKQTDLDPIPVYYGDTVACEAVVPSHVIESLRYHFREKKEYHSEER